MSRVRCAAAAAFTLALMVAQAGCGYENRKVSEPAGPQVMPRAKERVPVRALCEWRVKAEGDAASKLQAAGILVVPPKTSSLSKAAEALRARAAETGLFESVAMRGDGLAGLQEGEVLLVAEECVASIPNYWDVWRMIGVFPPFYLLMAVWSERSDPFVVDFTLRCIDRNEVALGHSSAQTTILVNAQTMDGWAQEGRVEAEEMARAHAVSVLVAKLASDEGLAAELRKRAAASAGPVAVTYPPPAAPRWDAPPAPLAPPPPPPAASGGTGSTFVLAIGIDRFQDAKIPALRFAEADAREMYGFFATERRSPTAADRVLLLAGKDATRRGMREAIREHLIRKAVRPEDTVILFYAGHGFRDAEDTYLACADTDLTGLADTAISMEELRSMWGKLLCERRVLIVDACHSGAVGAVRGVGGVALAPETAGPAGAPRAAGGTLAISATGENELSTEDANLGHGVFSLALLRGLRGEADTNRDGAVTGEELGPYLRSEVPRLAVRAGGKQTPVVTGAERCPVVLSR